MVVMLFFNDETSFSQSMEYDRTIATLKADIASCHDSAAYYRRQREAIVHGTEDVERLAREKFHMQKPSEDVYILR